MVPLVRIGDQKWKFLGGSELVAVQQQPRGEVSFCDVDGFHMGFIIWFYIVVPYGGLIGWCQLIFYKIFSTLHGSLWFGKDKGSIMESAERGGTIL